LNILSREEIIVRIQELFQDEARESRGEVEKNEEDEEYHDEDKRNFF
jgi:hypothetical protein